MDLGAKIPVVWMSPELGDGEHRSMVDDRRVFLEACASWWDEFHDESGNSFTVEVDEMTREEIERIPEL